MNYFYKVVKAIEPSLPPKPQAGYGPSGNDSGICLGGMKNCTKSIQNGGPGFEPGTLRM